MKSLYEADFYAWTQQQIELLKEQAWHSLDVQNLIEELADLGRRERQELSYLAVSPALYRETRLASGYKAGGDDSVSERCPQDKRRDG